MHAIEHVLIFISLSALHVPSHTCFCAAVQACKRRDSFSAIGQVLALLMATWVSNLGQRSEFEGKPLWDGSKLFRRHNHKRFFSATTLSVSTVPARARPVTCSRGKTFSTFSLGGTTLLISTAPAQRGQPHLKNGKGFRSHAVSMSETTTVTSGA
eukprot:scaffold122043_cov15-Tisochrysis_lutea.AAC.1